MVEAIKEALMVLESRLEDQNGYEVWKPRVNEVVSGVIEEILWERHLKKAPRLWVVLNCDNGRVVKIRITRRLEPYFSDVKPGWLVAIKCIRKVGSAYELKAVLAEPNLESGKDLRNLKIF